MSQLKYFQAWLDPGISITGTHLSLSSDDLCVGLYWPKGSSLCNFTLASSQHIPFIEKDLYFPRSVNLDWVCFGHMAILWTYLCCLGVGTIIGQVWVTCLPLKLVWRSDLLGSCPGVHCSGYREKLERFGVTQVCSQPFQPICFSKPLTDEETLRHFTAILLPICFAHLVALSWHMIVSLVTY